MLISVPAACVCVHARVCLPLLVNFAPRQKSYKNAPPLLSSGVPILGNFIGFAKDPVGFVRQSYNKVRNPLTHPCVHMSAVRRRFPRCVSKCGCLVVWVTSVSVV